MTEEILYINIPFALLETYLDQIEALSFGIEVYFDSEMLDRIDLAKIRKIKEGLDRTGIKRNLHAPYLDISLGSSDKKIREVSVERILKTVEIARQFSASSIVIHTGYDGRNYKEDKKGWIQRFELSLRAILTGCEKEKILLENVFEEDPLLFKEIFSAFPEVGFCFDTGHFNVFSRVPLSFWLKEIGGRIKELHLHDNSGFEDNHNPIGTGNFPFLSLKDLIKKQRPILTIEVLDEASALLAIEKGKRFLKWLIE